MKYLLIALFLGFAADAGRAETTNSIPAKEKQEKLGYIIGYNIGSTWKRNGIELNDVNIDVLINALRDAMAGHPAKVSDQEKENKELMTAYQAELRTRVTERRKQLSEKNKKDSEAFLAQNKSKPDIHTLPDGLQYKVLSEGTGPKPATNDTVLVNYRGTLVDGTEFDSSAKHGNQPSQMRVNAVIKGWSEALQMMPTGAKWELFVPSDLGYGERGTPNGSIGPNAALVFEMELVGIKPPEKTAAVQPQALPKPQPVTSDIIKVPSKAEMDKGAKIEIIKPDQLEKEKDKAAEKK